MILQEELIELGKEKLAKIKALVEELQVQVALGKSEAKEVIEKERKNLIQFLHNQQEQFRQVAQAAENYRKSLEAKLEALEPLLMTVPPHGVKKYDQFKKQLLLATYEIEKIIKDGREVWSIGLQSRLHLFKEKLDAWRIELALKDYDNRSEIQPFSEALLLAVKGVREKLNRESELGEKIEYFTEQINLSVEHLRKAFSELLS